MDNMKLTKIVDLLTSIDETLKLMVGPVASINKNLDLIAGETQVKTVTASSSPEEQVERLRKLKETLQNEDLYKTITRDDMLGKQAQKLQDLGVKRDNLLEGLSGMAERLSNVQSILSMFEDQLSEDSEEDDDTEDSNEESSDSPDMSED